MGYKFVIEKEHANEIIPYVKTELLVGAIEAYLQYIKDKLQKSDIIPSECERLTKARAEILDIFLKHNVDELFKD